MTEPLQAVRDTAAMRRAVELDFRAALKEARKAGHSLRTIAEAAGMSRQGIHYWLKREEKP